MPTITIASKVPLVQSALKARPLRVTIDGGEEQDLSLSKPNEVEVEPGDHHVEMYVAWVAPARMGPAEIDVSLADGDSVQLLYKPPWIRTKPGKLTLSA
ncbi:MAG TPA: hypothetical protein VGI87_09110 [Solirubrobacteraceae bacterium]|jgi:hypothetical protein